MVENPTPKEEEKSNNGPDPTELYGLGPCRGCLTLRTTRKCAGMNCPTQKNLVQADCIHASPVWNPEITLGI